MSVSYTDIWGPVLDTGSSTQPTPRPNVEVEFHFASEIDTGAKVSTVGSKGSGHRPPGGPR